MTNISRLILSFLYYNLYYTYFYDKYLYIYMYINVYCTPLLVGCNCCITNDILY